MFCHTFSYNGLKMLTMQHICRFGATDPSKNNYCDAERINKTTKNLFSCGKELPQTGESLIKILAYCIPTSGVRTKEPHKIFGEITTDGKIQSMVCSCPAGEGEACKHVIATLLRCYKCVSFLNNHNF